MSHPFITLGVSESATNEEIREAYVKKISEFTPESSPVEFEQIRDAYQSIKDELCRAKLRIFGQLYSNRPLSEMLPSGALRRNRIGVDTWIDFLNKGKK